MVCPEREAATAAAAAAKQKPNRANEAKEGRKEGQTRSYLFVTGARRPFRISRAADRRAIQAVPESEVRPRNGPRRCVRHG